MTISQVYQQYRIMPSLQLHLLRVTAVAKSVCENFQLPVDTDSVIRACLLHDIGNIIKFDLTSFPQFLQPEGLEYWQQVKQEYLEKYGTDEHVASMQIARDLGMSERVVQLIKAVGFLEAERNHASADYEAKICDYADTRVTPHGVVSLQERLEDLEKRYGHRYASLAEKEKRLHYQQLLREIEEQIFAHCALSPDQITDSIVSDTIEALKTFEIS